MQREEFLRSPPSFEAELAAFLLPYPAMRLFHEIVAAGGGDDLDVLHGVEHGKLTQGRPIVPQLVGVIDHQKGEMEMAE